MDSLFLKVEKKFFCETTFGSLLVFSLKQKIKIEKIIRREFKELNFEQKGTGFSIIFGRVVALVSLVFIGGKLGKSSKRN